MNLLIRFCNLFIPKDEKYILFGSWYGNSYSDNTRYMFEYMLKHHNEFILIWIGKEHVERLLPKAKNVIFCRKNSLKSIYYILKSKYAFFSQGTIDLFETNVFNKTCLIYLSHGAALKKWGDDDVSKKRINKNSIKQKMQSFYIKILGGWPQYDYCVVTSPLHGNCVRSALAYAGGKTCTLINSGYPRNDMLLSANNDRIWKYKEKYASLLGFSTDKRVVLYVPTFRRTHSKIESFCHRNPEESMRIKTILNQKNAVLIEKNHYGSYVNRDVNLNRQTDNNLIYLGEQDDLAINIQELLLITDILITDYSSVIFDYVLLDKPSICFAYDYEYYRDIDSGLYYEIEDYSPGKVTRSFEETCQELERLLNGDDNYINKRRYVRKKYMPYDDGNACEKIFKAIFKSETQ